MASIHCCWKNCREKNCVARKRGRHCPKQKKNNGLFGGVE